MNHALLVQKGYSLQALDDDLVEDRLVGSE